MFLFRMILVLAVVIGAFGFIIYHVIRFFIGINSTRSQMVRDQKLLSDRLKERYDPLLIDLDKSEMELLSYECVEKVTTDGLGTVTLGFYPSIYHEPLIAYGIKNYFENDQYLVVARTRQEELVFKQVDETTNVYRNGVEIGEINREGELIGPSNHLLARLEVGKGGYHIIFDTKRTAVHLKNLGTEERSNQRVFPIEGEIKEIDREMALILTIYKLLIQ